MTCDVYVNSKFVETRDSAAPGVAAVEIAETLADKESTHYVKVVVTDQVAKVDLIHFPNGELRHDRIVSVPEGMLRNSAPARANSHPVIRGAITVPGSVQP